MRLTRRGRVVVFLVAFVAVLALGIALGNQSFAGETPGTPEPTRVVMVGSGETLWAIAADAAGDGDGAPWSTRSRSSTHSTPPWSRPASASASRSGEPTVELHQPLRPRLAGRGKTKGGASVAPPFAASGPPGWTRPSAPATSARCSGMAGYSATPLVRKLGIKDTHVCSSTAAPDSLDLGDLGGARVVRRLPARHRRHAHLPHRARVPRERLPAVFEGP